MLFFTRALILVLNLYLRRAPWSSGWGEQKKNVVQEAGLEQQKEGASSLLKAAKQAEAATLEGERKTEATRCVFEKISTIISYSYLKVFSFERL